jgi:hypothetical protein
MSRLGWTLVVATLLATSACEQKPSENVPVVPDNVVRDETRGDAAKAVDAAADFSQQTKEVLQSKLDEGLKKLDTEIAKLREKGSELTDQAKVDWDKKMADLETKRAAFVAKLADVGQASQGAWSEVVKGARAAWDDLEKAYREASR